MLFYIFSLSHLDSICRGLAGYSISFQALAVSAKAWRAYHALEVLEEAHKALSTSHGPYAIAIQNPFQEESKPFKMNCRARY